MENKTRSTAGWAEWPTLELKIALGEGLSISRSVRMDAPLASRTTLFAFDARSLLGPVTMQTNTSSRFDSPSSALGVRSGQALDFARDDSGWGVLNL